MSLEELRKVNKLCHPIDLANDEYKQENYYKAGLMTSKNNTVGQQISCKGCGQYISDKDYLQMAQDPWHVSCLSCSACGISLQHEQSCYSKDGLIFCKEDYFSQYSRACAGCGCLLSSQDYVLKARNFVYHLFCFTCTTCRRQMSPGERFSVDEETGRLHCCFCWKHYDDCTSQQSVPGFQQSYCDTIENPFSIKQQEHTAFSGDLRDLGSGQIASSQKLKRMRTSFKHNQLRAMKNYFNINHNPDAKDLKQLAQETGLTKRVLQVWFQNARAKHRRSHMQKHRTDKDVNKKVDRSVEHDDDGNMKSDIVSPSNSDGFEDKGGSGQSCGGSMVDSNQSDDVFSPNLSYSLSPTSTTTYSPTETKFFDRCRSVTSESTVECSAMGGDKSTDFLHVPSTVYPGSLLSDEVDCSYRKTSELNNGGNSWQTSADYTLFSLDGSKEKTHSAISKSFTNKISHATC